MSYWASVGTPTKTHKIGEKDKPIIAYKKLKVDNYASDHLAAFRSEYGTAVWKNLSLHVKDITNSGSGPGIYTFKNKADANNYSGSGITVKLELSGTVYEFSKPKAGSNEITGCDCSQCSYHYPRDPWPYNRLKPGFKAEKAKIIEIVTTSYYTRSSGYYLTDYIYEFIEGNASKNQESIWDKLSKTIVVPSTLLTKGSEPEWKKDLVAEAKSIVKDSKNSKYPIAVFIIDALRNYDIYWDKTSPKDFDKAFNLFANAVKKVKASGS